MPKTWVNFFFQLNFYEGLQAKQNIYYRRMPLRKRSSSRRNNWAGCHWPLHASLIKVYWGAHSQNWILPRRLVLLLRRGIERLPANGDGEIGTLAEDNRLQIAKLFVIHLRLRRCQPASQPSSERTGGRAVQRRKRHDSKFMYIRAAYAECERKREFHSKKHLHKFSRANKF